MKNLLKKAELSINMIVIVAICVIVLVVVVYLVINQANQAGDSVACPTLGGVCTYETRCGEVISREQEVCRNPNHICCNPLTVRSD